MNRGTSSRAEAAHRSHLYAIAPGLKAISFAKVRHFGVAGRRQSLMDNKNCANIMLTL
jgi:hypothetical protein